MEAVKDQRQEDKRGADEEQTAQDPSMSFRLLDYHFALRGEPVPPVDQSRLHDYLVASNATFARGLRPGLEVCIPVSYNLVPLKGLERVEPYAKWGFPRVPAALLEIMLAVSRGVYHSHKREALFHLPFGETEDCSDHLGCADGWHVEMPEQCAEEDRPHDTIRPVRTGLNTSTARAVIEVHSHHEMKARFSAGDDNDESQGFRVFAVLGQIVESPSITVRVGLFGHYYQFPATEFFKLPEGLADSSRPGRLILYSDAIGAREY